MALPFACQLWQRLWEAVHNLAENLKIAIKNGHLVDPKNQIDANLDVFIADSSIVAIGTMADGFDADITIDASGQIVCPGLVDLRARMREPGLEKKATIDSETLAAVKGGITTIICPPDTKPVIDTPAMAQMVQQRAWQTGRTFIHPLGALTQGLKGEALTDMWALANSGCVGMSNALAPITNSLVMRRAMQYASTFDIPVFLHSQDPWLTGNGVVHEGFVSTELGLPSIPEAAETVGVARDLALIETTGATAHLCQLSSGRAVSMLAEAQQKGIKVSADVSAHHLHLSEHDIGLFNTLCHVQPPLRGKQDRRALRDALKNGVINAICSDHQPHGNDAKLLPFSESEPGISGLETLLALTLKLVEDDELSLHQAIRLVTQGPAEIAGIDVGHLSVEARADVCIFDPGAQWSLTSENMLSRGKNTPFQDHTFKNKVTTTLIGGEIVYSI